MNIEDWFNHELLQRVQEFLAIDGFENLKPSYAAPNNIIFGNAKEYLNGTIDDSSYISFTDTDCLIKLVFSNSKKHVSSHLNILCDGIKRGTDPASVICYDNGSDGKTLPRAILNRCTIQWCLRDPQSTIYPGGEQ